MLDLEMNFMACSGRWVKEFGHGIQDLTGLNFYQITPDIPEHWVRLYQDAMAGANTSSKEDLWVRADGSQQWLRWASVPWFDENGRIGGIIISSEDISEQKRADLALKKSEENHRLLFESSRDALMVYSPDMSQFTAVNKATVDLYRADSVDQMTKIAPWDVSPEFQPDGSLSIVKANAMIQKALSDGFHQFEWEHQRLSGERFTADVLLTRMEVDDQVVLQATVRDISIRKNMENQLSKLSQAVAQSIESIVISDINANIEYVNDAFVQVTGFSQEEAIGHNSRILQSGKTSRETYTALWEALSNGRSWKGELYNQRKDGSDLIEFATITPIRQQDGAITHYIAVKEDITEKKKLGEELDRYRHHLEELVQQRTSDLALARQAAETANVAKSTFLANMSHEIRTPLSGILGMAQILRRGGVSAIQADQIGKIELSGKHLLSVINDILDLSKIEAGKLHLEHSDFKLSEVIASATTVVEDRIKEKALSFAIDSVDVPQSMRGDPTRLAQGLVNYLGNAIKFTDKGSITLTVQLLEETATDYLLRFEVADTGVGIPLEQQHRLFSAFEQADNSTSRKYGGSGLGLAITKRIAELMGGTVGVDSIPNQGSTFWLTVRLEKGRDLVASDVSEPTVSAESEILRLHQGRHILVADDEPINREIATELLRSVGLNIDIAEDGKQAVLLAERQTYAAILMDMQMPQIDGLEATRAIRQISGQQATPIIAMTANAFTEDRNRCLESGMNDYIAKPIDPEILFSTMLKWLSRFPH
jgi:PAS domain S-box-containing protein